MAAALRSDFLVLADVVTTVLEDDDAAVDDADLRSPTRDDDVDAAAVLDPAVDVTLLFAVC